MIPGIMAAQMRVAAALWTPLNMATVPQIYLDAQDSTVTDVSGFASAISNLGAMGSDGDFSQGTAGSRPAILAAELNGNRVLSFDGSDDVLRGGSTAQKDLFRNVGAAWVFSIYKKRTADSSGGIRYVLHSSTNSATSLRFNAMAGTTGQLNKPSLRVRRLDGDTLASISSPTQFSGPYGMVMYNMDYATGTGSITRDGSLLVTNSSLTSTGSTSDTASATDLAVGASETGAAANDMDLAALVTSNTAPSASDIDKLFGWAAHKYGLTASLPGGHPYKTAAPTV
jgi:hypothetical protein